jgi:Rod binding domain-containing protein
MKTNTSHYIKLMQQKDTKKEELAKLKKDCKLFEAEILKFYLNEALKSQNALFPKSPGEEIYKSMYERALSDALSGNFGYSKLLFDYLSKRI